MRSLFGDHHIYGMEGVRFYTKYKAVTQRWTGVRLRDLPLSPERVWRALRTRSPRQENSAS